MKRSWMISGLAMVLVAGACGGLWPAARVEAAGLAPEETERLQRLNGLVEDLLASQAAMQKRIASLTDELSAVRDEGNRAGDRLNERFASREELRRLAESVRELDRKREEDKRLILEEIRKLGQVPVPPAREPAKPPGKDAAPAASGKGYKYTIKKGDTISAVVAAYRASGVNVTVDDVLKANPDVKPTALSEGKEIFIPDPSMK